MPFCLLQVDTPDSVLQSGLGLTDLGQHAVLRSMVDPRDFDRLRHFQMNGGAPNTFEETIHRVFILFGSVFYNIVKLSHTVR